MGAQSKRAKKVRSATEFDLVRIASELRWPRTQGAMLWGWDLDKIRGARDAQMLGLFRLPAELAMQMGTDDAIYTAKQNRLAPQRGLPVKLFAPNTSARAGRVLGEAEALFGPQGIGVTRDTLADINATLADHGIAFAVNVVTPRPDGSRVDFEIKSWPIEFVQWDPIFRKFKTQTEDGGLEYITHGDGRWIIFQKHELQPWRREAAILPGAIVYAAHAFGIRDFAKASMTHGNAKVVGTMPENIPTDSPEGRAFLDLLEMVASADTPVGIKPFGSEVDYITNNSNAWQVFKELLESREKAAARIYLGQDGTQGTNPTAPGVDSKMMFGVRDDIVDGDLRAMETGLLTGTIEPWAAINFGDSSLAPSRLYLRPDTSEDARQQSILTKTTGLIAMMSMARKEGITLDPAYIAALASDLGVRVPVVHVGPLPAQGDGSGNGGGVIPLKPKIGHHF